MTARIGALRGRADHPISPSEFLTQLLKIWRPPAALGKSSQPAKIGLCVSGGPDSMALAYLFQQLKKHEMIPGADLKALIIDHAHRATSQNEASRVSKTLLQMGVQSRVIALQWTEDCDHSSRTDFETAARLLRYRCFAHACLEEEIRYLFLGHHQSDQVETILFRLIRGQTRSLAGLLGMRSINNIPHSADIFGASDGQEAAPLSQLLDQTPAGSSYAPTQSSSPHRTSVDDEMTLRSQVLIAHAGIKICRPMLSIPKSRLVATCEANGVPFVVDQSNFDPTVTKRNAIRWLLKNDKLPIALREDSILRLGAAAMRSEVRRKNKVEELLSATYVISFDLRSGRLLISIPWEIVHSHNASEIDVASYVDRLLRLVGPASERSNSLQQLTSVARWMFPALSEGSPCGPNTALLGQSVTAHGVRITRQSDRLDSSWELSRQPFRVSECPRITFAPAATSACSDDTDRIWSKWTKWDGRYWIRIRSHDPKDMSNFHVRALNQSDMMNVQARKQKTIQLRKSVLLKVLRMAAPGKVLYTLPVLLKYDCVRTLPTCNIGWPSSRRRNPNDMDEDSADGLEWEVRYKDVSETLQHLGRSQTHQCEDQDKGG